MNTLTNAILGLTFLAIAFAAAILMFKLWGYPYDEEKLVSSAPKPLMRLHRILGYVYLAIYVYLMVQMFPRIWSYQVELPPRTVAHLVIGMSIGVILLVKILIVRFFKHLEAKMAPFLGTSLLVGTVCLIGLSTPIAFRELALSASAVGGNAFGQQNLERTRTLLVSAGFPQTAPLDRLASADGLRRGRQLLLVRCVQCHDLRTVLLRPRTPDNWLETVGRMADRAVFTPITEEEQWAVASYLIAITPELQRGLQQRRQQDIAATEARAAAQEAIAEAQGAAGPGADRPGAAPGGGPAVDMARATSVFEDTCSQCHELTNVSNKPPRTPAAVRELIARMVENGLKAKKDDIELIVAYLTTTYVK